MEKPGTKRTKRKTLQITYPAPYSQSWNPDVLPVLMKNSVGRSTRPSVPKRMPEKQIKPSLNPGHVTKVPQVLISKRKSVQAAQKNKDIKKSNSQFPPVFVIRNKDRSNSRQLSLSKTVHMDIKPKRAVSLPPSFCPSPNFRALSRKLSPRRFRQEWE